MPEMHLRQPSFTSNACEPFLKKKERIWKFKGTRESRYICQNRLDKARFPHNLPYEDFKGLASRTASHTVLLSIFYC